MTRALRTDERLQSPILAMAQPSHLEQRSVALLNPSLNRLTATPWAVIVVAGVAIGKLGYTVVDTSKSEAILDTPALTGTFDALRGELETALVRGGTVREGSLGHGRIRGAIPGSKRERGSSTSFRRRWSTRSFL